MFLYSAGFSQKNIEGLINAEKAFAKYAFDSNVRDAFVKYLDTNNIAMQQGKVANGYQQWVKRKKGPGKLLWGPEFAAIASSGEYGVTTGPYEFKASLSDTALGRGHFTSIWYYNSQGEWKNLIDHGIGYANAYPAVTTVKQVLVDISRPSFTEANVVKVENNFIEMYKSNGKAAYNKVAATNIWFNTNGHQPVNGINNLPVALAHIDEGIEFTPLGFGMSNSNDFGYVYGSIKRNDKMANYIRVWIKENSQWKLLLQVLD